MQVNENGNSGLRIMAHVMRLGRKMYPWRTQTPGAPQAEQLDVWENEGGASTQLAVALACETKAHWPVVSE